MKRPALILTASALALATTLAPTSSFAQWRGGWGGRGAVFHPGGWGYRGYHGYRGGNWGVPLAAGLVGGLALGALASSASSGYGYGYGYHAYAYPPAYGYGYGYAAPAYGYGGYGRAPGLTRNSSCADVRARPSLYSESVWASCGLVASGPSDWGSGVVR
jgi:hypothetical protein